MEKEVAKILSVLKSIDEKSDLIESSLAPLSEALKSSKSVQFHGTINGNNRRDRFSNHSQLVNYLCERLLPICNSSRPINSSFVSFRIRKRPSQISFRQFFNFPKSKDARISFFGSIILGSKNNCPSSQFQAG